jgi:hypothetical protein
MYKRELRLPFFGGQCPLHPLAYYFFVALKINETIEFPHSSRVSEKLHIRAHCVPADAIRFQLKPSLPKGEQYKIQRPRVRRIVSDSRNDNSKNKKPGGHISWLSRL